MATHNLPRVVELAAAAAAGHHDLMSIALRGLPDSKRAEIAEIAAQSGLRTDDPAWLSIGLALSSQRDAAAAERAAQYTSDAIRELPATVDTAICGLVDQAAAHIAQQVPGVVEHVLEQKLPDAINQQSKPYKCNTRCAPK